jgi:hypothetical protein
VSHIRGRFSVDVQFNDSTAAASVQAVKSISLQHATEYDFGKVAVVTGTVGTAAVTLPIAPAAYKDSGGDAVSFASVSRVAFAASGPSLVACDGSGTGDFTIYSRAGQVAASDVAETTSFTVNVIGTAGTAAYTLVMYGS